MLEAGACFFIADARMHDHIVARLPVRRCRDRVCVNKLQRVDHTEDLAEVPPRARRIRYFRTDHLVWVNEENIADCELVTHQ